MNHFHRSAWPRRRLSGIHKALTRPSTVRHAQARAHGCRAGEERLPREPIFLKAPSGLELLISLAKSPRHLVLKPGSRFSSSR
jgi:hypothetical protein